MKTLIKSTIKNSLFSIVVDGDAVETFAGYKGALTQARSYLLYGNKVELVNHTKGITILISPKPKTAPAPAPAPEQSTMVVKIAATRCTITGLRYLEKLAGITDRSDSWKGTGRNIRNAFVYPGCKPMLINEAFKHVVQVIERQQNVKIQLVFGSGEFSKNIDYV